MKRYQQTAPLIRQYIKEIFNEKAGSYRQHQLWPLLHALLEETNEVCAAHICKPIDSNLSALCVPVFIDNFHDPVFEAREWAFERVEEKFVFNHRPHIQKEDLEELYALPITLKSLPIVRTIFLRILSRADAWTLLSGPISSGGTGSRSRNLHIFHRHIVDEAASGPVFNQMPFEEFFGNVHEFFPEAFSEESNPIMDEVYIPVLESKRIKRLKMLKGWHTSRGSKKEFEVSQRLQIEIVGEELPIAA